MRRLIFLISLISLVGFSCKEEHLFGCTKKFVSIVFQVKTMQGIDAPLLDIVAKNQRTGREIELESHSFKGKTSYVLADDSDDEFYSRNGDKVTVSFTYEDQLYTNEYVIAFDGCHIEKKSGPDEFKVN